MNRLIEARKQMEKIMKGVSKGKLPDLGALAGEGPGATNAQQRTRKATKSNKRKKRSKTRR